MGNLRALVFWILPPILGIAVVCPFVLSRGDGPTGERVAAIVISLVVAAFIQGIVYRAIGSRGRS